MLNHRTNVLFEEKEWQALAKLAKREGVSVGNLLRRAAKMLIEASKSNDQYQLQDQKKVYLQVREGRVAYSSQRKLTNAEILSAMRVIATETFVGEPVTVKEIKQWIEEGRERKLNRDTKQRKLLVKQIKDGWKQVKNPKVPINYEALIDNGRKY